jgi:hypothetical protein
MHRRLWSLLCAVEHSVPAAPPSSGATFFPAKLPRPSLLAPDVADHPKKAIRPASGGSNDLVRPHPTISSVVFAYAVTGAPMQVGLGPQRASLQRLL